MGEKDNIEKTLEGYNDVFADILNVLLFNGDQLVFPDDLTDQTTHSIYKIDNKVHNQDRDVAKRWHNTAFCVSSFGLENQTDADADMPLRVISYDAAGYRAQLLKTTKNGDASEAAASETLPPVAAASVASSVPTNNSKKVRSKAQRYPVVTLVLHFNYKHHWGSSKNLLGCLTIDERVKPYVSDYRVNVFEIAYLTPEQVQLFRSDFRYVADYFVQMRTTGNYVGSPGSLEHVREVLELLHVLTGDNRFEKAYNDYICSGKKVNNMGEICFDRAEKRGYDNGYDTGVKAGVMMGKAATARKLYQHGESIEFIADICSEDPKTVFEWLKDDFEV